MRTTLLACLCAVAAGTVAAQNVGQPAPPFTILRAGTPAPPPLQLSQYRGKIVALAFIHTTCSHCQELTRSLIPIANDYAARGVQVLECAFNENAEHLVPGFVAEFHPSFPVGWNVSAVVMGYLGYSVMRPMPFVPHMVFLDRQGVLRGNYPGESDFLKDPNTNIRKELDTMLKSSPPPAAKK
jgi:hypothetical protein